MLVTHRSHRKLTDYYRQRTQIRGAEGRDAEGRVGEGSNLEVSLVPRTYFPPGTDVRPHAQSIANQGNSPNPGVQSFYWSSVNIGMSHWLIAYMVKFCLQVDSTPPHVLSGSMTSPHHKAIGSSCSHLRQRHWCRSDIDYLPEVESKGQTSL